MMSFTPSVAALLGAHAHAARMQPRESCGVIAGGAYHPLENRATDYDSFVMDMIGYRRVQREHGKIEAIVHSHVYQPALASDGDRVMCEKLGIPWLIVSWPTGKYAVLEPCGYRAPLVGRQWAWGSNDCFGLIRDGFKDFTGLDMPDFARDWLFWKNNQDLIGDNFAAAGFVLLPQGSAPQHCDVLGMQIAAPVVNHLGLFLAPDQMLHQLQGRLSVREVYGGMYADLTVLHFRHRNFLGAPP